MLVLPRTVMTDEAPEPSRTAEPVRVSPPVTVSPTPDDAPTVRTPDACVTRPPTAKLKVPIATVPVHPVVSREVSEAFASTVTMPPPEFASKKTGVAAPGTEHPLFPPEDEAQCVVCDQLPVPPTQYRDAPHGPETITSTTGSDPSIEKTTRPTPSTKPFTKATASLVTLNRSPTVFPPIVNVIVEVATLEVCVQVYRAPTVQAVNPLIVVMFAGSLFVTERFTTLIAPSEMLPDPVSARALKARLWPVLVRTAPLLTVRVPAAVIVDAIEIVPPIMRLKKVCPAARRRIAAAPVRVTVELPALNVAPAPEPSQFPLTVHAPDVSVKVPEVPPPTATLEMATVDALAVRTPASPKASPPPVRPKSLVASVVVPA